jgi:hypothetical protein
MIVLASAPDTIEVDYPEFDVDLTVQEFKEWKKDKEKSIVSYRDKAFKSPVTGAMAPANVKGVTMTIWPREDIWMMPSIIGMSSLSGELVLMIV